MKEINCYLGVLNTQEEETFDRFIYEPISRKLIEFDKNYKFKQAKELSKKDPFNKYYPRKGTLNKIKVSDFEDLYNKGIKIQERNEKLEKLATKVLEKFNLENEVRKGNK